MNDAYSRPILILGANSKLARAFVRQTSDDFSFRRVARASVPEGAVGEVTIRDSYAGQEPALFRGCRAVINFTGVSRGPLRINAEIPVEAARTARAAGVPHFVQISSLSVYGKVEHIGLATPENPQSAYGVSKYEADCHLQNLATDGFNVTLLRVPILYGGGAGEKIRALAMLMMRLGWFPVTAPQPQRSVLHVCNAAAVLSHIVQTPVFGVQLAADHEAFNFDELSAAIRAVRGVTVRQRPVPAWMLNPVSLVLPNLYQSVWRSSLIEQQDAVSSQIPLPITLQNGLKDLIARMED